jgi:hypothetical protein
LLAFEAQELIGRSHYLLHPLSRVHMQTATKKIFDE